ncbi:MAG: O-antigen ligase family protein [Bacteroidales bacterium]|nr:O-antigen ligase family protein [Bacteroidales bacterium]
MQAEAKYQNLTVIGLGIVFIFINAIVVLYLGQLYFAFAPIALLVVLLTFKSYDKAFFLVVFLTPLSLSLSFFIPEIDFNISLFTEPLLILILGILIFKFFLNRKVEKSLLLHPISIAVIFYLFWMLITTISSTLPLVSIKFWLVKLWFIIPVFYFGTTLFKDYSKIKPFLWLMAASIFIVVVISTIELGQTSFLAKNAAHFVVKPFYNDHTAYGAIVALIAPLWWGMTFKAKIKPLYKYISLLFALAFTVAVILSYSRASWIGLAFALGIWAIIKLKIRLRLIITVVVIVAVFIFSFWFQIIDKLDDNRQDSSSKISHHLTSITNISTDASNVERLNRWHCAIEMFKQKPITGWGPGTYQFQYAPFQLERMRTIISTNFGDIGNAHSEYLGPLAEQGLLGSLAFIWIAIAVISTGIRVYKNSEDKEIRMLALSITLGFMTYFLHGLMNNFLDTDKLAIPFWGFAAVLVALDIYHIKKIAKS